MQSRMLTFLKSALFVQHGTEAKSRQCQNDETAERFEDFVTRRSASRLLEITAQID